MEREFGQPYTKMVPIGVGATRDFMAEVASLAGVEPVLDGHVAPAPAVVDAVGRQHLPDRQARVHVWRRHHVAAARPHRAGTRWGSRWRAWAVTTANMARPRARSWPRNFGLEALITDDYLEVEAAIARLAARDDPWHPDGTPYRQASGHSLRSHFRAPCMCRISRPATRPQMGIEGANVIFDTWVHPLVMGLEEHLLTHVPSRISNSTTMPALAITVIRPHVARSRQDSDLFRRNRAQARYRARSRSPVVCHAAEKELQERSRSLCAARPSVTPKRSPQSAGVHDDHASTPCTRRRPTMRDEFQQARRRYNIAVVTLDSHSAGPVARARSLKLAQDFPGLTLSQSMHAAPNGQKTPTP